MIDPKYFYLKDISKKQLRFNQNSRMAPIHHQKKPLEEKPVKEISEEVTIIDKGRRPILLKAPAIPQTVHQHSESTPSTITTQPYLLKLKIKLAQSRNNDTFSSAPFKSDTSGITAAGRTYFNRQFTTQSEMHP